MAESFEKNENGFTFKPVSQNGDTFTISEEDAARVRMMAMQNSNGGDDLPPEMQQALNMAGGSDDYDQKIPDNIHNAICYDEAKKNNEKYKEEIGKYTNSIIHDNATRDILDEAEKTSEIDKLSMEDLDAHLRYVSGMSFLEAISYKKKIDAEIARWKSCKSMLKAVTDLKLDDKTNRNVMLANTLDEYKMDKSVEEFNEVYDSTIDHLSKVSGKLVEIVESKKDDMGSTKFMTNEMIEVLIHKIEKLDPNGKNYEFYKKQLETVLNATKDRTNLIFMLTKFESFLKSNKVNVRRELNDNMNAFKTGQRTKTVTDLIKFFDENITANLYHMLVDTFEGDYTSAYILMSFIARIMSSEKKSSRDIWAKWFVLNISDIKSGIYDIGEPSEYLFKVRDLFLPKLQEFIKENKFRMGCAFMPSLGLNTPVNEEEPEEVEALESADLRSPRGLIN